MGKKDFLFSGKRLKTHVWQVRSAIDTLREKGHSFLRSQITREDGLLSLPVSHLCCHLADAAQWHSSRTLCPSSLSWTHPGLPTALPFSRNVSMPNAMDANYMLVKLVNPYFCMDPRGEHGRAEEAHPS